MDIQKPVILFGTGAIARLMRYLLAHDSPYEVVATTVDGSHLTRAARLNLPLVPFEELPVLYPPTRFDMFIAIGYSRMNSLRAARYETAKAMGYTLISYVSPRASTWPNLVLGDNCVVMDGVLIQPFAHIGANTILWSGSYVGHEARVGDHCYLAAGARVSGLATVEEGCFLGTGSIVRDGITVRRHCLVGAGAAVMRDTDPGTIHAAAESRLLAGGSDRLPWF